MKKASAKIRRKVKVKFCRELRSLEQKFSNVRHHDKREYLKENSKENSKTNSKVSSK